MDAARHLSELLLGIAAEPLLLVPAIVLATFFLEDVATVAVALLASQMLIDDLTAVAAVVTGTALGDLALYAVARCARSRPRVRRWLDRPALDAALGWMRRHAVAMVVIARFTPGLRLPVFAGAGTIGMAALPFAATVILSTLIWTPGLYWIAQTFGMDAASWRVAPLVGLVALLALTPYLVRRLIARKARV